VNIHTHLVPFLFWLATFLPGASSAAMDAPEQLFLVFALTCLFCSSVWHTMAGCAHAEGMDLCARIDYVGIGWCGANRVALACR
jgi:adiponectin receptor